MQPAAVSFLKNSSLIAAFVISMLLHAVALSVGFTTTSPEKAPVRALDVILVNSRTVQAPKDAQALAQANLDGGGNVDQDRRASTPLPSTKKDQSGEQLEEMHRRVQELEKKQQRLMAKTSQEKLAPQVEAVEPVPHIPDQVSGFDLSESARAMARLEGEIAKNTDEYSKRPRKKFVGARTSEYRFAQYIEDWRQKVERVGTLNYPEAAKGKLYGILVMSVTLGRDGNVLDISIDKSSGHKILDDAARRIVQMSSPFSPFPPAISSDTDQLVITRAWTFTRNDSIETK